MLQVFWKIDQVIWTGKKKKKKKKNMKKRSDSTAFRINPLILHSHISDFLLRTEEDIKWEDFETFLVSLVIVTRYDILRIFFFLIDSDVTLSWMAFFSWNDQSLTTFI